MTVVGDVMLGLVSVIIRHSLSPRGSVPKFIEVGVNVSSSGVYSYVLVKYLPERLTAFTTAFAGFVGSTTWREKVVSLSPVMNVLGVENV